MNYDILIVGGGIVGLSLAVGLKNRLGLSSMKVGLVDSELLNHAPKPQDHRTIALSMLSCKILKALSLRDFTQFPAHPIRTIHASHQGHFAMTRLNAKDIGVAALGHSIEMSALMRSLQEGLDETDCELLPASVRNATRDVDGWSVDLETNTGITQVSAKLLIAADGDHSFLRKLLHIPSSCLDYGQSAMVTTVETTKSPQYTAFERFISNGSIALLPIAEEKFKLVWIASSDVIETLASLDSSMLLNSLQNHLGSRLGTFHTLGAHRHLYPLRYLKVEEQVRDGFVLMGNAAHVLHPIAAQGFNLSLRDVAVFIEVIDQAICQQKAFDSYEILQSYLSKRCVDQRRAALFTQGLASFFTRDFGFMNPLRSVAFNLVECAPFLKKKLLRFTTGNYSAIPRWVFD